MVSQKSILQASVSTTLVIALVVAAAGTASAHAGNRAPNAPEKVAGMATVPAGIEVTAYSTRAVDPDGDAFAILMGWGDGNVTRLPAAGFAASGTRLQARHAWSVAGAYNVTAVAIDQHGNASVGSTPLRVTVVGAAATPPAGPSHSASGSSVGADATLPTGDRARANLSWSGPGPSPIQAPSEDDGMGLHANCEGVTLPLFGWVVNLQPLALDLETEALGVAEGAEAGLPGVSATTPERPARGLKVVYGLPTVGVTPMGEQQVLGVGVGSHTASVSAPRHTVTVGSASAGVVRESDCGGASQLVGTSTPGTSVTTPPMGGGGGD